MAGAKEIRTQIASIKSTQKITRAMEMVATSKMRRARDLMAKARPYAKKIRHVIYHLGESNPEYQHAFLQKHTDVKRIGYIIVSSDRGLCGGLNVNLFKAALKSMQQWQKKGVEIDLCLIGSKAEAFFKRHGGSVLAKVTHLGDRPEINELIGVVKVMLDAYEQGKIDRLYLVANKFVNTMTQKPMVHRLLPIERITENDVIGRWDYIYEPDAKELLDALMTRYIESQVYQAAVENLACEQAARMIAMKSATDNASDFIDRLQLVYNKARQAAITQEIAEIVGGAAAV